MGRMSFLSPNHQCQSTEENTDSTDHNQWLPSCTSRHNRHCFLYTSSLTSLSMYTVSHKKRSRLIFVCNFVKYQRILMHFSLLELAMNNTCDGMDFIHLT